MGKRLGKYDLIEELGRGGFGIVYRARDSVLERDVALKVLHAQLMVDEEFSERFRNEAKRVASIEHPNIVGIYEYGEDAGRAFIAMRLLPGGNLRQRLKRDGKLGFEQAFAVLQQAGAGLKKAHERGLVHRDIKPENILFDEEGAAVVTDFGLAKAVLASGSSSGGGAVGTPAYRAPELWRGKPPASAATDVYSLGCVFAEMLSGRQVFSGDTPDEIITKHLIDGAVLTEGLMPGLRAVLAKALRKDPGERYASAAEFIRAVEQAEQEDRQAVQAESRGKAKGAEGAEAEEKKVQERKKDKKGGSGWKPAWWKWALGIGVGLMVVCLVTGLAIFGEKMGAALFPTETPRATATTTSTSTPKATATPALGLGSTRERPADGMLEMYVPAGSFQMGSTVYDDEKPGHTVTLDAFWIDRTEVTNGMYVKCVQDGECDAPDPTKSYTHGSYYGNSQYTNYPVIYVSWNDAAAYCAWAGAKLPSEAQWEFAAGGTDGRTYPWGDETPTSSLGNFYQNVGDTTAVGRYPDGASWVGALDMAGNVWEWVADWYGTYSSSSVTDPQGPSSGEYRVLRGGSWYYSENNVRSALRYRYYPDLTNYNVGFRCSGGTSP